MKTKPMEAPLAIRPMTDADEPAVLQLLEEAMGGGPVGRRVPEFFRWKHINNPFGRSFMILAESEGRVVGLRAFMRWRFASRTGSVSAVRAVDTATHPDHQGRGIFSRLTLTALESLREDVDLVFNTPNDKSLPGYLKMGWSVVSSVPVLIRPQRPLRLARRYRDLASTEASLGQMTVDAPSAANALTSDPEMAAFISECRGDDPRLHTVRDLEYLRWRYAEAPYLDYRAVRLERGGRLQGLGIFRVRPRGSLREATVAEVVVRPGDARAARQILKLVRRASAVDHQTAIFPRGSTERRAALGSGFVRSPRGIVLVAKPLRGAVDPNPLDPSSWALSLGDLEVF